MKTDQSVATTLVRLGEPMSFIGVTYRNVGARLLTGARTTLPPNAHHSMTEGAQKQETGSALHNPQAAQQIGWGLSFLDSSAKLCFLQSAWLL